MARGPDNRVTATHDLPFSVTLQDFVLETYPGTMRPSGFKSIVKVTDRDTGKVYDAKIWMNNPLEYRGYTLFQSSYQQDRGREATVLSVAKDPGQNIVFAGYITMVLGMIIVLFTRVGQSRERAALEARDAGSAGTKVAAAVLLALLAGTAQAASTSSTADTLRRLPVQHDGRSMPLDTQAREAVWKVTGTYRWHGEDPVLTVTGWLSDPQAAANASMVKVGSADLAREIGLPSGTTHASFLQIVRSQRAIQLMEQARQYEQQGRPRTGVIQDAEKLEPRLMALQAFLSREAVRVFPVAGNPNAQWGLAPTPTPEGLLAIASGPRLPGWPTPEKIDVEIRYNELNPVRLSWIILLAALVVSIAAMVRTSKLLDVASFVLLLAGFAMMSWGILLRWDAGERIPAANMYESMLFLAWGVGFFAVIAYAFMRNRVVVVNAAVMAALTMALTDLLPIDRFIHPIAPVLAGTPWLAIHVPIIMVGYAVLALGLVVAHMQIGFTIFAPSKVRGDRPALRSPLLVHVRRLDPARRRHPHRVDVGGVLLGALLGLGSQGGLVAGGLPLLHGHPPRQGRQDDRPVRRGGHQHRRLPDHPLHLPGRELRPHHRHALLRHGGLTRGDVDARSPRWRSWPSWPGAGWPSGRTGRCSRAPRRSRCGWLSLPAGEGDPFLGAAGRALLAGGAAVLGPGHPGTLVVASHGEDPRRALVQAGPAPAAGARVDVGGPGDAAVDAVRGRGRRARTEAGPGRRPRPRPSVRFPASPRVP